MTRVRIVVAAASVLLAACSMVPKYERPQAPVPANFPYAADAPGSHPVATSWEQFFVDERLRALIAKALTNNRDLRIALLNMEQARAQYDIRVSERFPTVGATVAGSRAPNASGGSATSYTAGLAISNWEIDFFGRIASLSEAALAQFRPRGATPPETLVLFSRDPRSQIVRTT